MPARKNGRKNFRRWNDRLCIIEKQCRDCQKWLPNTDDFFNIDNNNADGLRYECRECRKIKTAQYRAKNPDLSRNWYAKNKTISAVKQRVYRAKNRDRLNEKARLYRAKHHERFLAYSRQYHSENDWLKEKKREWAERNPDIIKRVQENCKATYGHIKPEWRKAAGDMYKKYAYSAEAKLLYVIAYNTEDGYWIVRLDKSIKRTKRLRSERIVNMRHIYTQEGNELVSCTPELPTRFPS